jgi:hypothetical protein
MRTDFECPQQELQCLFPLRDTEWPEGEIEDGLSIRRLAITEHVDLDDHYSLSRRDCQKLLRSALWIRHTFRGKLGRQIEAYDQAGQLIRDLIGIMLVFRPKRQAHVMLFLPAGHVTSPERISTLPEFVQRPIRVNVNDFGVPSLDDLRDALARFRECSEGTLTRLVNPVRLLEHGIQAREPHLATLLWTMGLDALLMASNKPMFVSRLCRILGRGSYIFGPGERLGEQPVIRVGDAAEDLYRFRSELAHGSRISQCFLARRVLYSTAGETIECGEAGREIQYRSILHAAALFLLAAAIRAVLTDEHLFKLAQNERTWRKHLES